MVFAARKMNRASVAPSSSFFRLRRPRIDPRSLSFSLSSLSMFFLLQLGHIRKSMSLITGRRRHLSTMPSSSSHSACRAPPSPAVDPLRQARQRQKEGGDGGQKKGPGVQVSTCTSPFFCFLLDLSLKSEMFMLFPFL